MFCEKCGNPIKENERFCAKCGTPVPVKEAAQMEERAKPRIPNVDTEKAAETLSNAASAAADGVGSLLEKGNAAWKKMSGDGKKSRIFLIAGVAAAVVVVFLLIGNFARINHFVHRQFTSPEKYYQFVERKTIKEITSSAGDVYDSYVLDAINLNDKSVSGELSLELGEAGQELISLAGLAGVDLSWLEGVTVGADFAVKDNIISMRAEASVNKDDVISGNLVVGLENESVYLQIPELTKTYLGVELEDMLSGSERAVFDELQEQLENNKKIAASYPNQAQLEKLIDKYLKIALGCVDDVSKSPKTIKAEGIQQKCTELKVKISYGTMRNMAVAILEEARDDRQLEKILIDMANAETSLDMSGEDIYEMFQDEIDDMLSDIEQESDYMNESYDSMTVLEMKVYVDGKGDIRGRSIERASYSSSPTISIKMPEKGRKFGFELSIEGYGEDVKLSGTGKRKGDKITGDFQIKYNGTALADIAAKDWNTEDLKRGMPNGTLTIGLSSNMERLLGTQVTSLLGDVKAVITFDTKDNSGKYKFRLIRDGEDVGTISASVKSGKGSKASIPSSANTIIVEDMDDLADWMEDIAWDQFLDRIERTDLPSDWVDMLEDVIDSLEDGGLKYMLRGLW